MPHIFSVSRVLYHIWRMKTFMKTSSLFLMLCCALQLNTSAGTNAIKSANSICCFNAANIKIPLERLDSYFWTSSSCPQRHIVVVTAPKDPRAQKKQFCMDSGHKLAQRAINYLEKKHA